MTSNKRAEILSSFSPNTIKIDGFDCIDSDIEKIRWLRQGDDFRSFITDDIETNLNEQDSKSILHSLNCFSSPEYLIVKEPGSINKRKITILEFSATFFIKAHVTGNGGDWMLDIELEYVITNKGKEDGLNLQQNFNIIAEDKLK